MPTETITTQCAIAGGGPAGMMLGYLLARAGIDVLVLEKHADFLRDFRGDTIHPSTLRIMHELGILDAFLKRPHQEVRELSALIGDESVIIADFSHLPEHCRFVALMPQWDFLDFLASKGGAYSGFHLRRQTEVTGLIEQDGRVTGVRAKTPDGEIEISADLVLGCDGRHSTVRDAAKMKVRDIGAPIEVLWFRMSRPLSDPEETMARIGAGRFLVMLNRHDYWQCAFVIHKGGDAELRAKGLDNFRQEVGRLAPFARNRVQELNDWDKIKLLTVTIDRLEEWARPGLLCIGDAAHAMSPVGGVGINLAIQDAVATANRLAAPLRERRVTLDDLRAVQARRIFPTKATQFMQTIVQKNVLQKVLADKTQPRVPWLLKLISSVPLLQRLPAYFVGIGVRPEHIETPVAGAQKNA
jgi:2-polyprenyl-6-methoxyphenol hydroxylase-like FAD-dependent oxidoreductase